jgi:hypothetical protein
MNPVTELETAHIDELLGAFRDLQAQFDLVRERVRRAEEHRHTVARRIYDRVRSDYDRELDAIRARLTPLRDELERVHDTLESRCREALAATQTVEEELAEAEFRHRIGEFEPAAFDAMRSSLDARATDARARHASLQSALDIVVAARTLGAPATPPAGAPAVENVTPSLAEAVHEEAPAAMADPIDTPDLYSTDDDFSSLVVDEPPSLDRAHEIPAPAAAAAPAPETMEAPVEEPGVELAVAAAQAPSPRTESFVNPQAWVSEMGADKARPERRVRLFAPPAPRPALPKDDSALAPLEASIATAAPAPMPTPAPSNLPSLVFVSGAHTGQAIALLPTTLTIGREHDNNVEIKDPEVARYHARILRERDAFVVEDLNSSTGTFVNGERKNRAVLSHGDVIRVGQTELALDFEWTTDSR